MSADKYPSIFSRQLEAIVYIATRWRSSWIREWRCNLWEHLTVPRGEPLLIDFLFYLLSEYQWKESELLKKCPEWKKTIFPLMKQKQYAYLFTINWYLMLYIPELSKVCFERSLLPFRALNNRNSDSHIKELISLSVTVGWFIPPLIVFQEYFNIYLCAMQYWRNHLKS